MVIAKFSVSLAFLVLILLCCTGCGEQAQNGSPLQDTQISPNVVAEIETTPLPGVTPELATMLKQELIRVLTASGTYKATATPPVGPKNMVNDLVGTEDGTGGVNLAWTYRNVGDYDQNTEVNIADLTAIGINFMATPADANWPKAQLADGDENGEINVSDITPIGQNFLHVVASYNVYVSVDLGDYPESHDADNGPGAVLVQSVDMGSALVEPTGLKRFEINIAEHTPGMIYWVRPVDSEGAEGSPSNAGYINTLTLRIDPASSNQPDDGVGSVIDPFMLEPGKAYDLLVEHTPDGDVSSSPETSYTSSDPAAGSVSASGILSVDAGASGEFDVYASYKADVSQTLYFEVPDNEPPAAALEATPSATMRNVPVSLSAQGSSDPDGTIENYEWDFDDDGVFNEAGDEAGAEGLSTVQHQWADAGAFTIRVQVTDNRDATDSASVEVTVASNFNIAVDSDGWAGEASSLALVNGVPAIAYFDGFGNDLKFAWASDLTGASWSLVTPDAGGNVGDNPSLTVVDGNPAVAYYDEGSLRLMYVRAEDATGSTWGTPVVTSDGTRAGQVGISLVVVEGQPAIAFSTDGGQLNYVRALDATGATWDTSLAIDTAGGGANYCSMAIVDGNPAIAHFSGRADTNNLLYIRATDATGSTWGSSMNVQTAGVVGLHCSLAVVDGAPAIAYFDDTNQHLEFIRSTNATGSGWGAPISLDIEPGLHRGISLAVIAGRPAVSYQLSLSNQVRLVWATDAAGTTWNTPDIIASTGGATDAPTSLAEIDGRPAITFHHKSSTSLRYAVYYE